MFDYPGKLTIECDDARTMDLINTEDTAFDTKLRHVDIHGHWLRQEVREGQLRIRWVSTRQKIYVILSYKHQYFCIDFQILSNAQKL